MLAMLFRLRDKEGQSKRSMADHLLSTTEGPAPELEKGRLRGKGGDQEKPSAIREGAGY
jgi:hypothetical protein